MKKTQIRKTNAKSKKEKQTKKQIRVRATCTSASRKFLDASAMSDCHLKPEF